METGIYLRVSTEEQAQEGFSIRGQEQKLRDYARIKEWPVYKVYADEGISGKNITERPAINELISDVEKGIIKNILVFKIDRLTRNTVDLINLTNLFNKQGCAFNSLMESIDTETASGRMFLKIIGIFAEFERENIAERVRLGFERKAREGYSLSSWVVSYGYDRPRGQKIQTINEIEACIVREIFDMFTHQHLSYYEIANKLNLRNIPTKQSASWSATQIRNMLSNCNYIGNVRYSLEDSKRYFEAEGVHEPIISKELYEETQTLISKMVKRNVTKRPKDESYFLNFVICPHCGERMTTHGAYTSKNGWKAGYRCINYSNKKCDISCLAHFKIEEAFSEYITNVGDCDVIDEIELKEEQTAQEEAKKAQASYLARYEKLCAKEKEFIGLYIDGKVDYDNYATISKTLTQEKHHIEAELETIEKAIAKTAEPTIKREDIIKNLKANWELLTKSERRQFLVMFVEGIHISLQETGNKRYRSIRVDKVEFCKN